MEYAPGEHYAKYGKKYYEEHKQESLEKGRKWQRNNRKRAVEIVQAYVARNKEKVADYNKNFGQTISGRYRMLGYRHKQRDWSEPLLTLEQFTTLSNLPCLYCGNDTNKGLDRVDNEKGYSFDNVAPCCKLCNYMKKNYTTKDFLSHVASIARHNNL